jgi:DNA polymerase-4
MTGEGDSVPGFCRDCLAPAEADATRCGKCRSPRLLRHPELYKLTVAHLDCDAFYAAVEKRDDPSLRDKPVIIGGGKRGVVSTACYIARIKGVRSAMPMFKALKLCPEATVIPPNMEKYAQVGREVRAKLLELTPMVEPLSIDEAFLDLGGTERLHGHSAAVSLATLALTIEREIGITVSIGLAYNKFLAKVASDLEKPRGFSVIGKQGAKAFLASQKVSLIWGVGKATQGRLAQAGITDIAQLQTREKNWLMREFGSIGARLYHLSRGEDVRHVEPDEDSKSISAETTFNEDIADYKELERILWQMSERVSRRAKKEGFAGSTVVLKLKTADFRLRTRNVTLGEATQLADTIFSAARPLLRRETGSTRYRLLGVGITHLSEAKPEMAVETLDATAAARGRAEIAMDRLREKFGRESIERGLGFSKRGRDKDE